MKKIKKKLLSFSLTMAMILTLIPLNSVTVFAATEPVFAETITATESSSKTEIGIDFKVEGKNKYGNNGIPSWNINSYYDGYAYVKSLGDKKIAKLVLHLSSELDASFRPSYYPDSVDYSISDDRMTVTISNLDTTSYTINGSGAWQYVHAVDIYYIPHTCSVSEVTDANKKAEQAATCTEDGWNAYWICSCGKVYAPDDFTTSYDNEATWKSSTAGKKSKLGHDWGYAADEVTLTATCKRDSAHTAVLTLSAATPQPYSASPITASYADVTDWTDNVGTPPTITYEYKETADGTYAAATNTTDVGYYKASATVGEATAYVEYQIEKCEPYIATAPTAADIEFGQTLADSTLSGGVVQHSSTNASTVAGTFAWTTGTTAPAVSDSDNTDYEVTFTPNDTKNYDSTTCNIKLTVNKADYTSTELTRTIDTNLLAMNGRVTQVTLPTLPAGASYGSVTNTNTEEFTVGDVNAGKVDLTSKKDFEGFGASSYTFTVAVNADGNHNDAVVTVTVHPMDKEIQTLSAENVTATFGDTDAKIVVTDTTEGGGALSYAVTAGDAVTVDASGNLTIVKVGAATVTVTAAENDTYAEATVDVIVTINPKTLVDDMVSLDKDVFINKDTAQGPVETVKDGETALVKDVDYTVSGDTSKTEVGTYTLTITGKGNYTGSVDKTWIITNFVNPRTVVYDANGGLGPVPASQTVEKGSLIDEPVFDVKTLKRGDCNFQAWFKDPECTEVWNFESDCLLENITLYAGYAYDAGNHDVSAEMSVSAVPDFVYTGKAIKPVVTVMHDDNVLKLGKDYTVSYKNNVNANLRDESGNIIKGGIEANFNDKLPTIIIKGKGNYKAEVKMNFNILPYEIGTLNEVVTATITDFIVINPKSATTVKCALKVGTKTLKANKDYKAVLKKDTTEYPNLKVTKGETGTYKLTVTGAGNYQGSFEKDIVLTDAKTVLQMNKATVKLDTITYEGTPLTVENIKAKIKSVKIGKTELAAADYTVSIAPTTITNVGKYALTLTSADANKVGGSKTVMFTVKGMAISKSKVTFATNTVFDGTNHNRNEMVVTIKVGQETKTLVEGTDYEVTSIKNDYKAGTATVVINGIGIYSGSKKATYKIAQREFKADNGFTVAQIAAVKFQKSGAMPDVDITFAGKRLVKNVDYKLTYKNNKKVGAASVTVTGKGNFKGQFKDLPFTITEAAFEEAGVTVKANDVVYNTKNPKKYQAAVTVLDGNGKKLVAGKDYVKAVKYYEYSGDFDGNYASSALATHKGAELTATSTPVAGTRIIVEVTALTGNSYSGTVYGTYRVAAASISKAAIKFNDKVYTGESIELTVPADIKSAVIGKTTNLTYGVDYEIVPGTYTKNVKVGTAKVTIRGIGNYGGTKVVSFKIVKKDMEWWKK